MRTLSLTTDAAPDRSTIDGEIRLVLRDFIALLVGDVHTAEDLTQEVLLKAYRSVTDIDHLDNVAAWLYRIARNTVVDHFRARDRHPDAAALRDDEVDVAEGPADGLAVDALAQCLRPLIDQLDPMYRQALTLTDLDGRSQAEAARQTEISISGMKSRVQRGRAQLRSALLECCAVHTDAGGRISSFTSSSGCCTADPSVPTQCQENRT
jgi:RNA polymerase sigma-70 factor (ECF subfamily)